VLAVSSAGKRGCRLMAANWRHSSGMWYVSVPGAKMFFDISGKK